MYMNYEESYMCMVRQAHYLTDLDGPLVYAGLRMAQALDAQDNPSTALMTEYTRTCRHLIAGRADQSIEDELNKFLKTNMK